MNKSFVEVPFKDLLQKGFSIILMRADYDNQLKQAIGINEEAKELGEISTELKGLVESFKI